MQELLRKGLHFLICFVPLLSHISKTGTLGLLGFGIFLYSLSEVFRLKGLHPLLFRRIASITVFSARGASNTLVPGPITLGLGAMVALILYPSPVMDIALYCAGFGDGFASLVGKLCVKKRPHLLRGKSLQGSLACFAASLVPALLVSTSPSTAVIAAITATLVEVFPLGDWDNIAIPVIVGGVLVLSG